MSQANGEEEEEEALMRVCSVTGLSSVQKIENVSALGNKSTRTTRLIAQVKIQKLNK